MAYDEFLDITKRYYLLDHIAQCLGWDKEVVMRGGENERSEQEALIARLSHETLINPRLKELIEELKKEDLDEVQACNVKEMDRLASRARRIPASLVRNISICTAKAFHEWKLAREKKDFSLFAPRLKELVGLMKEYGRALGPGDPYENLIQDYEPHLSVDEINSLFADVKEELTPLREAIARKDEFDDSFFEKKVEEKKQVAFSEFLAKDIGFDFSRGRLDTTTHPFTCHPADVRITTRFTNGWGEALTSVMHEGGHGLYEQGLPQEHFATPRGSPMSFSVHESQSRLYENHIGLSEEFWKPRFAKLQESYGLDVDFEVFMRGLNKVKSGFIRVQADELTYPLHIVLRYEIERDLISGDLEVDDLPRVWNEKMQDLLGITPPDDSLGVLQDVHWSYGSFGYFPTYLLGTMMSAQFVEDACAKGIAQEEMLPWLREVLHGQGCLRTTQEMLEFATGKRLTSQPYVKYLKDKYTRIYNL